MRCSSWYLTCLAAVSCGFSPETGDLTSASAGSASTSAAAGAPVSGAGNGSFGGSAVNGGAQGEGGEPGTPGRAGTGSADTGGMTASPQIDPAFHLLWRDEFDTFDTDRWSKATHTFPENLARFSEGNAVVEAGLLKLRVSNVPNGDKPYSAAEVLTKQEFTFGRFEGRIKFCAGSGMVSSLFTYKQDVNESWQEIDIEHLGYLPTSMQYNLISGTLASRKYQPKVVTLQYSPAAEFHDYAVEWKPDGITFYVDGVESHRDVQASLQDAAHLHMNAWPTDNAVTSFAGKLDTSAIPCEAQYDWVAAYAYSP
jgi:endo-1,3-1,4-beta-glycanase ExoK